MIEKDNSIVMKFFKKSPALFVLALFLSLNAFAQEPNFSMYHYTPMFTNPGQIGAVQDVRLMLNYRNQSVEAGDNFRSSSLSGYYPVFIGNHRLVVAGNFLNDQASDFVSTNGGMLGVAYSIQMSTNSSLSLGLQGGYFQRKTDSDFTTDDQFVNGEFDPNVVSGDAVLNQNTSYPTLSGGIYYQMTDEFGSELAFVGLSLFNAIEPNISFIESGEDKLPMSLKATAGYRVYKGMKLSVMPTLRWINQADNNYFNLGSRLGYELENTDEGAKKVELGLWYNTNDLGVFSVAYQQPSLTIGVSYDLPISDNLSAGQSGFFELAVSFRLKKKRSPQQVSQSAITPAEPDVVEQDIEQEVEEVEEEPVIEEEPEVIEEEVEEEPVPEPEEEIVEEREVAPATIGRKTGENQRRPTPGEILTPQEKKVIGKNVRFELNSDELTADSKAFLDEVIVVVKNRDQFEVELTGYTCDLGEEALNNNLAQSRAEIVAKYFVDNGVDPNRLVIKSRGENYPIADNSTEEGRQKNRRVEFKLTY